MTLISNISKIAEISTKTRDEIIINQSSVIRNIVTVAVKNGLTSDGLREIMQMIDGLEKSNAKLRIDCGEQIENIISS